MSPMSHDIVKVKHFDYWPKAEDEAGLNYRVEPIKWALGRTSQGQTPAIPISAARAGTVAVILDADGGCFDMVLVDEDDADELASVRGAIAALTKAAALLEQMQTPHIEAMSESFKVSQSPATVLCREVHDAANRPE